MITNTLTAKEAEKGIYSEQCMLWGRGSLSLQERIAWVLIFQLFVSFTVFKIEAPKGIKDECY